MIYRFFNLWLAGFGLIIEPYCFNLLNPLKTSLRLLTYKTSGFKEARKVKRGRRTS